MNIGEDSEAQSIPQLSALGEGSSYNPGLGGPPTTAAMAQLWPTSMIVSTSPGKTKKVPTSGTLPV
jgi:hypothetical protein